MLVICVLVTCTIHSLIMPEYNSVPLWICFYSVIGEAFLVCLNSWVVYCFAQEVSEVCISLVWVSHSLETNTICGHQRQVYVNVNVQMIAICFSMPNDKVFEFVPIKDTGFRQEHCVMNDHTLSCACQSSGQRSGHK